jgi:hypothetical protein
MNSRRTLLFSERCIKRSHLTQTRPLNAYVPLVSLISTTTPWHRTMPIKAGNRGQKNGIRVAVLHQAVEPPVINGVRKPQKPGGTAPSHAAFVMGVSTAHCSPAHTLFRTGYQDSGVDIVYALQQTRIQIITPTTNPDPHDKSGWSYPDTEEGIISAIQTGATHLWANTILFASHPLQVSPLLNKYADSINVVAQLPLLVEKFDDKESTLDCGRWVPSHSPRRGRSRHPRT